MKMLVCGRVINGGGTILHRHDGLQVWGPWWMVWWDMEDGK